MSQRGQSTFLCIRRPPVAPCIRLRPGNHHLPGIGSKTGRHPTAPPSIRLDCHVEAWKRLSPVFARRNRRVRTSL
ncbi:unnamed protein product [Ectocarpus sp. 8 AP-2014]